ncbi:MAG: ribokinase [Bacteroidota bacterium]|nr:ribokinase [Bacteroidota bacterium]
MKGKVLVIGSSNTDMVVKTAYFPKPGETIIGGKFLMNAGGKGANQAVAAARMGAEVTFISKIGNDIFGKQAVQGFENEGINTDYIITDNDNPSGVALITVDKNGENSIVVAPGANMELQPFDFTNANHLFEENEVVLMQLETPINTISFCAKLASKNGKKVILNPAPATQLSDELLNDLYLITPNETETEILTGIQLNDNESIKKATEILKSKGVKNVIITLGAKGIYLSAGNYNQFVPAPKVVPIDTTAAGDVFNGALAAAIAENMDWLQASEFACKAASVSVTRMGAQTSVPFRKEL